MNKLKYPVIVAFCFGLFAAGFGLNEYFKPHRDVKTAQVFDEFEVDDFIAEFLDTPKKAQEKYLASNGEAKIVAMTGTISAIETNLNNQLVIELKSSKHDAVARFTLLDEEKSKAEKLKVGDKTKLTGVVSAGAEFDKDFNRYMDAILEQAYF